MNRWLGRIRTVLAAPMGVPEDTAFAQSPSERALYAVDATSGKAKLLLKVNEEMECAWQKEADSLGLDLKAVEAQARAAEEAKMKE